MSSHVTDGGASLSASQPATAIVSAATMTGPSSQDGRAIDSSLPVRRCTRRPSLFLQIVRGSRRVSRADCIRLALVGVALASIVIVVPAGGQDMVSPLAPINGLRDAGELPPVAGSAELDQIAQRYLDAMLDARCVCPVADGQAGADRLLDDVRIAIGNDAAVVDAGLVVAYDRTPDAAITTAVFDPAHGAAILGKRMSLAGMAAGVVEVGESWLAPPPGGVGPEIDLGGYTLVVIVMAGSSK